jgi:broad specificity phosphatase PhoE
VIELVYETHSITTDNEAGIATGWLPGRLSESGKAAARALGERRRDDRIELVFSSDLARAVETAEVAFAGSSLVIHEDARLRECNYGELNGHPVAEIDAERLSRL